MSALAYLSVILKATNCIGGRLARDQQSQTLRWWRRRVLLPVSAMSQKSHCLFRTRSCFTEGPAGVAVAAPVAVIDGVTASR